MAEQEQMYVIGVGEDPVRAFYYIEDKNGEKAIPVFTTLERLERHVRANLVSDPEGHMTMMEGNPLGVVRELTAGRFSGVLMGFHGIAEVAVAMDADYLVRDPRPGAQQETLRLPK